MKISYLLLPLISFFLISNVQANPFACKIQKVEANKPQKISETVVFKGFAVIGDQRFGLVQIGKSEFEVQEGDIIKGIHFKKVSSTRLDYFLNNKNRYLLLDSD